MFASIHQQPRSRLLMGLMSVLLHHNFNTIAQPTSVSNPDDIRSGLNPIPLIKRIDKPFSFDDGIVDWDTTDSYLAQLVIKYQNGIMNYQLQADQSISSSQSQNYREEVILDLESHLINQTHFNHPINHNSHQKSKTRIISSRSLDSIANNIGDNLDQLTNFTSNLKSTIINSFKKLNQSTHWLISRSIEGTHQLDSNPQIKPINSNIHSKQSTLHHHQHFPQHVSEPHHTPPPPPPPQTISKPNSSIQTSNHFIKDSIIKVFIPNQSKPKTGKIPLINHQGLLWYGLIQVGSPPKSFRLDFDTGSADLWIPSKDCLDCQHQKSRYHPSDSLTSSFIDGLALNLKYGDGSTTSGQVYKDTISVAGLIVTQQAFGVASSLGPSFSNDPIDGILGLAYQSLSSINQAPFFESLISQNNLHHPIFSFKLSSSDSHLYLGGSDRSAYLGFMEWYPLISKSYWVLLSHLSINHRLAIPSFNAIIDTGTTIIIAPPDHAHHFWSQVPNSKPDPSNPGYYSFPCLETPIIEFSFGSDHQASRKWKIASNDLILGKLPSNPQNHCLGSIIGKDLGLDAWILGDRFLKNVYSSFDMKNHQVGFAELA